MDDIEVHRTQMTDTVRRATRPRKAAALVEYALILSLVSVLVVGSLVLVSGQTSAVFGSVASAIGGPQNGGCQGGPACADNNENGQGNNGNGQGNGNGNNGNGQGNGQGNNGNGQGDENGNPGGGNPGGGNPGGGNPAGGNPGGGPGNGGGNGNGGGKGAGK